MKVSVIIPVYKVENYVEKCLLSVVGQTYQNMEVILVDDYGGDSSIEKSENILKKTNIEWTTLHHECNKGLSAARNAGVRQAKGDFLFFVDSDDYLPSDAIELLVLKQKEYQAEVVVGSAVVVDTKGRELPSRHHCIRHSYLSTAPFDSLVAGDFSVPAWAKLVNRDWYLKNEIHFVDGLIHEDMPWCILLLLKSKALYLVDSVVYYYVQRNHSIMHQSVSLKKIESKVRIVELIDEYLTAAHVHLTGTKLYWLSAIIVECIQQMSSCKEMRLRDKLKICGDFYHRYPFVHTPSLVKRNVVKLANIMSTFLPGGLALYVAVRIATLAGGRVAARCQ